MISKARRLIFHFRSKEDIMKIQLRNLGLLKETEFEVGNLTVICGKNNTGKTYATYALYGFLERIKNLSSTRRRIFPPSMRKTIQSCIKKDNCYSIDIKDISSFINWYSKSYSRGIEQTFSAREGSMEEAEFILKIDTNRLKKTKINKTLHYGKREISITKNAGDEIYLLNQIFEDFIEIDNELEIEEHIHKNSIPSWVYYAFLSLTADLLPKPFIVSAERTGVSMFQRELDIHRNAVIDSLTENKKINYHNILNSQVGRYAKPVQDNISFIRELPEVAKRKSQIIKKHPKIIDQFHDIISGEYGVSRDSAVYYKPYKKSIRLSMNDSSSSIRSMLDLGFYLHHIARPGDLLMIDEPELNLHPQNQRAIARLFAALANVGIKIFLTTHSDYITKELSTLIMLSSNKSNHINKVLNTYKYNKSELLNKEDVKIYSSEIKLIKPKGYSKRIRAHTFVNSPIDSTYGIIMNSFDKTIDEMNSIQDEILYGGE